MKLPDSRAIRPEELLRLTLLLDDAQLVRAFSTTHEEIALWRVEGIPAGPIAAAIRYFARDNETARSVGDCVLCGAPAGESVAGSAMCTGCLTRPEMVAQAHGYVFRVSPRGGVGVRAPVGFEFPLFAVFSSQNTLHRRDPEVGESQFDAQVFIESDDYEALFDTFQLERRRQLVQALVQYGSVRINVDEVVFELQHEWRQMKTAPIAVIALVWSLVNERSGY